MGAGPKGILSITAISKSFFTAMVRPPPQQGPAKELLTGTIGAQARSRAGFLLKIMENKNCGSAIGSIGRHIPNLSVFIILTLVVFHKFAASPASFINGSPDDAYAIIWHLWWFKYSLLNLHILPSVSTFVESPFGIELTHTTIVNHLMALPFTAVMGPVASYNIMILASFVLSGAAMYLLAYEVTGNRAASLFAGLVYSFSPYHTVFSALGGMDGAQIQYMPLVLFFMLRYERRGGTKNLVALLVSLVFALFSFGYYAVITLLMTGIFYFYMKMLPGLFKAAPDDGGVVSIRPEPLRLFLLTLLVYVFFVLSVNTTELVSASGPLLPLALVMAALTFTDLNKVLKAQRIEWSGAEQSRTVWILASALIVFLLGAAVFLFPVFVPASRNVSSSYLVPFYSYIFPPPDHPLLGALIPPELAPSPDPLSGGIVHLGFILPALALFALSVRSKDRSIRQYFTILLISGVLLSLPPVIRINEFTFYAPFYYFHAVIQPFVDIRRMVLLMLIPLSVLSALGIKELFQRVRLMPLKVFLFAFLLVLTGVEFYPRINPVDMSAYPASYDWFSERRGDITLVEFPLTSIHDPKRYEPFYGQTIHQKRLINPFGVEGHDPAPSSRLLEKFMRRGGPLNEPFVDPENTAHALRYLGVRYAVVRKDKLGTSPPLAGRSFKKVADFPDSVVYEVRAPERNIFISHVDFYRSGYFLDLPPLPGKREKSTVVYMRPEQSWSNGRVWLWMGRRASVTLWGFNPLEKSLKLDFTVRSAGPETMLLASVDGKSVGRFKIGPAAKRLSIKGIKVPPFVKDLTVAFELEDESSLRSAQGFLEVGTDEKGPVLLGAGFTGMVLKEDDTNDRTSPFRYEGLYVGEV